MTPEIADAPQAIETAPVTDASASATKPALTLVHKDLTPGAISAGAKEVASTGDGIDWNHPARCPMRVVDQARGIIAPVDGSPRRKKIAICGFASSTRASIPIDDATWEIWGLNQLYRHIKRADVWFDIHHNWHEENVPGTDHVQWARDTRIPFYMQTPPPDMPMTVRYPIETIMQHFRCDYFTSSIAYMIALAIYEIDLRVDADLKAFIAQASKNELEQTDLRAKSEALYSEYEVALFGIDLTVGTEYFHEKPCAEYWIGIGSARNIMMRIPAESAICKQRFRYGYERAAESLIKPQEIASHTGKLRGERDEMFKRLMMLEGAISANERWQQVAELRERGTMVAAD